MESTLPSGVATVAKAAVAGGLTVQVVDSLRVVAMNNRIGFDAHFKPTETKKGAGAAFVDALVLDPRGIELPLRADYTMDKRYAKSLGLTAAEVTAVETHRDAAYNDGQTYRATRHLFTKATEFKHWLGSLGKENA